MTQDWTPLYTPAAPTYTEPAYYSGAAATAAPRLPSAFAPIPAEPATGAFSQGVADPVRTEERAARAFQQLIEDPIPERRANAAVRLASVPVDDNVFDGLVQGYRRFARENPENAEAFFESELFLAPAFQGRHEYTRTVPLILPGQLGSSDNEIRGPGFRLAVDTVPTTDPLSLSPSEALSRYGLDFAFGTLAGGPVGGVASVVASEYIAAASQKYLPENTPGIVRTAAEVAPGFILPGKAFGGGLTLAQRATGIGATAIGSEVGGQVAGDYGRFVGGLGAGMGALSVTPGARTRLDAEVKELTDPDSSFDVFAIAAYMDSVEEYRAKGNIDPSLIQTLRKELYSGDLGKITVKELTQNAIDAVRSNASAFINVAIDTTQRTIRMTDTGTGMLPEVVKKEYVDIGGSLKPDNAAGGFGIAKVAIFGNAEQVHVKTVAQQGNQFITTELTGNPKQWLDEGFEVKTTRSEVPQQTGTMVELKLRSDVQFSRYSSESWLDLLISRSTLNNQIIAWVDGRQLKPQKLEYQEIGKIDFPGGRAVVTATTDTRVTNATMVHYLNNGLYQTSQATYFPREIAVPTDVVIDVRSQAKIGSGEYAWRPDREGLRKEGAEAVDNWFKGEFFYAAAKAQVLEMQSAFKQAQRIGAYHIIVDTSQQFDPEYLRSLSQKPYLVNLLPKIEDYYARWAKVLESRRSAEPSQFGGYGLGSGYRAVHVFSKTVFPESDIRSLEVRRSELEYSLNRDTYRDVPLGEEDAHRAKMQRQETELADVVAAIANHKPVPNPVLFNPYQLMNQAIEEAGYGASAQIVREYLAAQFTDATVHEPVHAVERGHEEAFQLAYGTLATQNTKLFAQTYNAYLYAFKDLDIQGWINDAKDYQTRLDGFGDPGRNILGRASDSIGARVDSGYPRSPSLNDILRAGLQEDVSGGSGQARPNGGTLALPEGTTFEPSRSVELPGDLDAAIRDSAESVKRTTGAYPSGDPADVASFTQGGGRRGGEALGGFARMLDNSFGLEMPYAEMGVWADVATAAKKAWLAEWRANEKDVKEWLKKGGYTKQQLNSYPVPETVRKNKEAVRSAKTGQPFKVVGFRQQGGPKMDRGGGVFYTTNPEGAAGYGAERGIPIGEPGAGGFTQSLYVSEINLKNPLVFPGGHYDAIHELHRMGEEDLSFKLSEVYERTVGTGYTTSYNSETGYAIIDKMLGKWAKEKGYDGIIFRHHDLSSGGVSHEAEVFVLNESQAKPVPGPAYTKGRAPWEPLPDGPLYAEMHAITGRPELAAIGRLQDLIPGTVRIDPATGKVDVNLSTKRELMQVGEEGLARYFGRQRVYFGELQHELDDWWTRLTNDKAAKALYDWHMKDPGTTLSALERSRTDPTALNMFPPALRPYMQSIVQWLREVEARDLAHGAIDPEALLDDYFPGVFKPVKKGVFGIGRKQPGSREGFEHARARVDTDPATGLPVFSKTGHARSLAEAIAMGRELGTDNLAEIVAMRDLAGYRRIQADLLVERYKAWGLAVNVHGRAGLEEGWDIPNVAGFKEKPIPHSAGPGAPATTAWAVPTEIANLLNNAFDVDRNVPVRKALRMAVGPVTELKLLALTTTGLQHVDVVSRAMSWKMGVATKGTPIGIPRVVLESAAATLLPQARKHFRSEWNTDPRLRMVTEAGATVTGTSGLIRSEYGRLASELTRFPFIGHLADAPIGPLRVLPNMLNNFQAYIAEGLFDGVYQVVGKHIAHDMWDSLKASHKTWNDQQIASAVAENLNIALSSLENWRSVVRNEGFRDGLRLAMFSFSEQEGMMRGFFRGTAGTAATAIDKATFGRVSPSLGVSPGGRAASTQWSRFWVAHLLTIYTIANVVNYAITGELLAGDQIKPWRVDQNGNVKFNSHFLRPIVGFDVLGRPVYMDLFGQMDTPFRWMLDPDTTLNNRLSQPGRFVKGWLQNRTYDGKVAGTSENKYERAFQKFQSLGLEMITPITYSNLREGLDVGKPELLPFQGMGFNMTVGSLRDLRDLEARQRFKGRAYDDLSPGEKDTIDQLPNVVAARDEQQKFFTERGDNYSSTINRVRESVEAELAQYEQFYYSGGYLKDPTAKTLPELFHDIATKRLGQREAIEIAFEKTLEGFDKDQVDKDLDSYFNILPRTEQGTPDWNLTFKNREEFLNGLTGTRRRDLEEMLNIIEGRKSPLQQQFRKDMDNLGAMGYPFGSRATTAYQEKNVEADLIMWRWYGGSLNSIEAVDQALAMQANTPMPVKFARFGRRVDQDLEMWNASKGQIAAYLKIEDTADRTAVVQKYPQVNAVLVYWGYSDRLHTDAAAKQFDSWMQRLNPPLWSDGVGRMVTAYFQLKDTDKKAARAKYPELDAALAIYEDFMFSRPPVFKSTQSRDRYAQLTGADPSSLVVSP